MKKYGNVIKSILFLFILSVLMGVLSCILIPKNNKGEFGMRNIAAHGFLGEQDNTIDVLFIGDSLACSSFFPLQLYENYGFTSYTIGTPAQKMFEAYDFLETFLETQSPQVVILESGELIRDYSTNEALLSEISSYIPFFAYHDRWKNISAKDFNRDIHYTSIDLTKGYKKIDKVVPTEKKDYMKKTKNTSFIPKRNKFYLKRIQDLCEKKGIEFMMVSTITLKSMNYARHNSFQKLSELYHIDYLDLNLEPSIVIDWTTDTYDGGEHLNYSGAQKIGDYIGPYLVNKYKLKDRRKDAKYSYWNEYLNQFKETLKT